jgi:hypothetical protein
MEAVAPHPATVDLRKTEADLVEKIMRLREGRKRMSGVARDTQSARALRDAQKQLIGILKRHLADLRRASRCQ